MNKANSLKVKIKRIKLKLKYFINKKKGKPIFWSGNSMRQLGKTNLVLKDAIKHNIPIMVETKHNKLYLLNILKNRIPPSDVAVYCPSDNLKGKRIEKILLDCGEHGYQKIIDDYPQIKIVNGFVKKNSNKRNLSNEQHN